MASRSAKHSPDKIEKDKFTQLDLTLQLAGEVETVGLLISEPGLIYTTPGTTIISGDIIRRLPL